MSDQRIGFGLFALGDYLYATATGGVRSSGQLESVERYDPNGDRWWFHSWLIRPRCSFGFAGVRRQVNLFDRLIMEASRSSKGDEGGVRGGGQANGKRRR
jgi:hypothetical protein